MNCRFCGGHRLPWICCPIDQKTGKSTDYGDAFLCSACDIAAIEPLPSEQEIPGFYTLDSYYTQGASHFIKARTTLADRALTKLAWWLDGTTPLSPDQFQGRGAVCDLGCGNGACLKEFVRLGWTVAGVEPDDKARSMIDLPDIFPGTAERLPNEIMARRFDLVIMTYVLEHCRDPLLALRNAAAILRRGSLLWLEVPNKDCAHFRMFGAASECYDAPRHLHFFGPNGLAALTKRAGFEIIREYAWGLTRHHSPSWRATERKIRNCLLTHEAATIPPDHTFARSAFLLLRELLAPKTDRCDAIGLIARRI